MKFLESFYGKEKPNEKCVPYNDITLKDVYIYLANSQIAMESNCNVDSDIIIVVFGILYYYK